IAVGDAEPSPSSAGFLRSSGRGGLGKIVEKPEKKPRVATFAGIGRKSLFFGRAGERRRRTLRRLPANFATREKTEPPVPELALLNGIGFFSRGAGLGSEERGGVPGRPLRTLFNGGVPGGLTEGQLMGRFTPAPGGASEMAFGALVERHGP